MDTSLRSQKRKSAHWEALTTYIKKEAPNAPFRLIDIKEYTKIQWSDSDFSISKERLLLQINCPESYTISYSGSDSHHIRIKSISRKLSISKNRISLTDTVQNFNVIVHLKTRTKKQQIDIYHIDDKRMIYYVIPGYIILRDGLYLLTAGDDKQFQLAHPESHSQLSILVNAEEPPVQTFTSRPNPTEILKNREILEIKERTEEESTSFSAKWRDVGIGDSHMLAVCTDGRLYSWGTGIFGQLGLELKQIKKIQSSLIDFNTKMKKRKQGLIKDFDFCKYNLSTLKEGLEAAKGMYLPTVSHPVKINIPGKVLAVACGLYHSLVLDSNGDVFSFGLGDNGRLGHGEAKNEHLPRQIGFDNGMKVKIISAGYHNSFFISDQNDVYSCGAVSGRSLGHSEDTFKPKKVIFLENIYQISSAESHTGAINYEGKVILFGNNDFNKVGGESPHEIEFINNKRIRQVRCGSKHTVVLTEDFEVYTWGSNRKGQLGLSSTIFQNMEIPIHVNYLSDRSVCEILSGHEYTCAVTLDGIAYTWGNNSRGQLGIATLSRDLRKIGLPRILDHLLGSPVTAIYAGRYNIAFLTEEENINKGTQLFNNWKKFVMLEERRIKERANYKFCLTVKDINNQKLQEKVKKERYDQYMATKFPPTHTYSFRMRYNTDQSNNNLQNARVRNQSETKSIKADSITYEISSKKDSRSISKKFKAKKRFVIANIETNTIEKIPRKRYYFRKTVKEQIPTRSLDISQVMHIATELGTMPNVSVASVDSETLRMKTQDSGKHRYVPDLLNLSHSYPSSSAESVHLPPIKP